MSLYVKLVSNWYRDPKIMKAGRDARELYLAALGLVKEENSDGFIAEEQLRFLDIDGDGIQAMKCRAAKLVECGLWKPAHGGWHILAWFKHNLPRDAQLSEKRSKAGKAGAEARWSGPPSDSLQPDGTLPLMANGKSSEVEMASPTSTVTTTLLCSGSGDALALAVEGGSGGNGQDSAAPAVEVATQPATEPAVPPPDGFSPIPGYEPPERAPGEPSFNNGEYEPTDPQYRYDPKWRADSLLTAWEKRLGPVQPVYRAKAAVVLERLHDYQRLSVRQITAMVQHVCTDTKARRFWGTGRSPAIWLDAKGSERTWQHVLAHYLEACERNGKTPAWLERAPEPVTPSDPATTPRPKAPAADPQCHCRNGWLKDHESAIRKSPCPDCALGKWNLAHQWNPEWKPAKEVAA